MNDHVNEAKNLSSTVEDRKTQQGVEKIFETATSTPVSNGLRVTLTMEATSEAGMEWAMAQAFQFARERWMGVTVHHKDDPTTRASCRTTRLRKRSK